MQIADDKRILSRLPCKIAVSERARSASLGEIKNISLDGVFVATKQALPEGAVVPIAFTLGANGPEIRPDAEVVHHTAQGMGLRFVRLTPRDGRRLRRFVSDLNLLVSHHQGAVRVRDSLSRTTAPIADPERIRALLEKSVESSFVLIPEQRSVRETANLVGAGDTGLAFRCEQICSLVASETVLVLYTHDFVSYSFQTDIVSVSDRQVRLSMPQSIHYSERRSKGRTPTSTETTLSLPLPWRPGETVSWPIYELSAGGLSFRADSKEVFFWPGTALPGAFVTDHGESRSVDEAVVKHLTSMRDDDGTEWLRVGVAFGVTRNTAAVHDEAIGAETHEPKNLVERLVAWFRAVPSALSYFYHSRMRRDAPQMSDAAATVVRFNNAAKKSVVGLLNTTFDSTQSVRAPLIIIVPGFGGRKEVASPMALTLIHNFRRLQRDVGVLRLDGTNNLGESYKSPGCEAEGKHTLKFTIQDGVDDLVGAISWAQSNRFVDPTDIVVISLSMSAIAVRRTLTLPQAKSVSRWISVMGPADAVHAIANAMGNSDPYANYLNGVKNGTVTLFGCLVDGDHYSHETHKMQVATLDDARRDMAKISADCTWIVGKYDAFIDPQRVQDIMTVKAPGRRDVISMNAGHLPRTSEQALSQFSLITRLIWRHLFDRDILATIPSRGWLAAMGENEWTRVRHARPQNEQAYWKNYLLGEGGIGFDIWTVTPEYQQLVNDQVTLAAPSGRRFLDLGAGTGNIMLHAVRFKPSAMTAIDLVPEALDRMLSKVGTSAQVKALPASIEGTAAIAMRRWLNGGLANLHLLANRLPGRHAMALESIAKKYTERLHAILRGASLDIGFALKEANLPSSLEPMVRDIQTLARVVMHQLEVSKALSTVSPGFTEIVSKPGGLPLADASIDCIVCSLVLSYLKYPDDALAEMYRVMAPGGCLVISTMRPDSEGSSTYLNTVRFLEQAPESELPAGYSRTALIEAARHFLDNACALVRLEEEGIFHFWDGDELAYMAARAGFESVTQHLSFGNPAQAVIVRCQKP